MNRQQAMSLLGSSTPHERLQGARFFAKNATAADSEPLSAMRRSEAVSYVKKALDAALERCCSDLVSIAQPTAFEPEIPEAVRKQIHAQAVEHVTKLLLHEVTPRIGLLKQAVATEMTDFATSDAYRQFEHLDMLFDGIEQLQKASRVSHIHDFDLSQLIDDACHAQQPSSPDVISCQGPRPCSVHGDKALLQFAIGNGLRNACESVTEGPVQRQSVVINWGTTDVEYWVSILDNGTGIKGPTEAAFKIGATNKKGHTGMGLAIARQAMETLEGTVTLAPAKFGGAVFEVRWYK